MSHEVETMAWRGSPPWHGLGFPMHDEQDPRRILTLSGLDWTVSKRPCWVPNSPDWVNNPGVPVDLLAEGQFSLVRDSDNKVLGPAGPRYQPFQNAEVMELFREFTSAGDMEIEVAGSLKGGRIIWILAKIKGASFAYDRDVTQSYLLMHSPHIWGESLDILYTPVRVVCWNTLTQALAKKVQDRFRLIHNKGFAAMRETAELAVEQVLLQQEVLKAKVDVLTNTRVTDIGKVIRYYNELTIYTNSRRHAANDRVLSETQLVSNKSQTMMANFRFGPGSELPSAKDTWWGVYNGLSFYVDHQAGRRGRDEALHNAWLSPFGAVMKRRGLDLAVQYAQAA
jgi:phage/plasmid-like protein (TIGR03299 family)